MKHSIAEIYTKAEAHFKKQLPFVVYKKPNQNLLQLWLQKTSDLVSLNSNTQNLGFVFAPFFEDVSQVIFPIENSE
ncbi:MAG TPA: hypothetical protein VJ970_01385, partial [Flavobacteriaceae bacterium]|nr:hypothetical protein [Flavobacteriaceae bacterium]